MCKVIKDAKDATLHLAISSSYHCPQTLRSQQLSYTIAYTLVRCKQSTNLVAHKEQTSRQRGAANLPPVTMATVSFDHHFSPGSSKAALADMVENGNQLDRKLREVVVSSCLR